ncbi:MAG TPA: transposase, partial [Thermodesulfobacteriota bacterium]|nr:transposase [Thermodesulfobacteriota bacterium]
MKKNISQKRGTGNQKIKEVFEQFTGSNLTRFGGTGLIRRFFKRHRIQERIEERVKVEGRRVSKYSVGAMFTSLLYGIFLGYPRPSHMKGLCTDRVFQKVAGIFGFPVQSTISRFLSALRVEGSREIAMLNFDLLMGLRKGLKSFRSICLDLDSHVSTVYGSQQRAGVGYN